MSKINKVVVKGVSYDIEDAYARRKVDSELPISTIYGDISDLNYLNESGIYNLDNIRILNNSPIDNQGAISARLTVLVTESGGNKVITQVLNLNNNEGGEGNVYIRSCQNGEWKAWGKLQTNVEVGQVNTLDHFTDNGMYSGVLTDGTPTSVGTFYDTFVLIVINNYAVSIPTGNPQSISQLKYSLGLDGSISVASRKRDQYGYWDNWASLDEKSLVEEEKTRAEQVEQELANAIAKETKIVDEKIANEKARAEAAELANANAISNEVARATQAEADAVERGRQLALRALFTTAGAEYNDSGVDKTKKAPWGETVTHKAGHYYLNGLGDITEEEMSEIFFSDKFWVSKDARGYLSDYNIRTNIPAPAAELFRYAEYDFRFSAISSDKLEVLVLCNPKSTSDVYRTIPVKAIDGSFNYCISLKRIFGVIKLLSTTSTHLFATVLEHINLLGLKCNLDISKTGVISQESVLYMIQNAAPTSAITITLHADAYARLAEDADIVAALAAQPLITLVSA